MGFAGTFLNTSRLLDENGRRRRFHHEGKTFVCKGGNHHGNGQTWLHTLSLGIERLAKFHDVEAALTERGTDGRRRIGLPRRHLQLDKADNFLCHDGSWCLSSNVRSNSVAALLTLL